MPIYEYQCESCGERLEKLQRMNDPALKDCPACQKPELKRLISAAGFRLKGSGWYETDFKKDNRRNLAESSSSGPKKDSSAGATASKDSSAGSKESPSSSGKSTTKKTSDKA